MFIFIFWHFLSFSPSFFFPTPNKHTNKCQSDERCMRHGHVRGGENRERREIKKCITVIKLVCITPAMTYIFSLFLFCRFLLYWRSSREILARWVNGYGAFYTVTMRDKMKFEENLGYCNLVLRGLQYNARRPWHVQICRKSNARAFLCVLYLYIVHYIYMCNNTKDNV